MKKPMIILIIMILILLICVICIKLNIRNSEYVGSFNLYDYSDYICEFPFDKEFGPVDSASTAKKYAEQIWIEQFGENVLREKPYEVYFDSTSDTWLIKGNEPTSFFENNKTGVAYLIIRKENGAVLAVWHEE